MKFSFDWRQRSRIFDFISLRVMIRWSLETQRKFTIIGSTERKVKIIRVSSVIGVDYSNVPQNLF